MNKEKFKGLAAAALRFITNPKLLLCFGIAWFITNGWAYLAMALGIAFANSVIMGISGAYIAFLWLPLSPSKLACAAIAIFLMKRLFPDDTRTLAVLDELYTKAKNRIKIRKDGN